MKDIAAQLKEIIKGDVFTDELTRDQYKHDASIFQIKPAIVVIPKDAHDIQSLVDFVAEHKKEYPELSITMRSGGTDMSGGPLTDSILVVMKNFDRIKSIRSHHAIVEPGVYYRDLERQLNKQHLLYPSYPASKMICTVGGIANNNSGGEKSLQYGKTEDYINHLRVILRDGNEYLFRKIDKKELDEKKKLKTFEGDLYRKVFTLVDKNYDLVKGAKPKVSKNSTGYNIWNVWDREKGTFDMAQLFVGAQGTLGAVTEINFRVIEKKKHRGMLIMFLKDFNNLPEIVQNVLRYKPVSFESFDDHTFTLALKFFFAFAKILGGNFFKMAWSFFPEFLMVLQKGMPKLILLAEFEGDELAVIHKSIKELDIDLQRFDNLTTKVAKNQHETDKYFAIRRESFNLLRQRIKNKHTAPFIDDMVVNPDKLAEFLPRLYKMLDEYKLLYTIAGHVGNGNFHIIPLMNFTDPKERAKIYTAGDDVFKLILEYGGSLSGEHNDGLIRSPYLKMMYGEKVYNVFKEVKEIFDPENIFNPHKKIGVTKEYASKFILRT